MRRTKGHPRVIFRPRPLPPGCSCRTVRPAPGAWPTSAADCLGFSDPEAKGTDLSPPPSTSSQHQRERPPRPLSTATQLLSRIAHTGRGEPVTDLSEAVAPRGGPGIRDSHRGGKAGSVPASAHPPGQRKSPRAIQAHAPLGRLQRNTCERRAAHIPLLTRAVCVASVSIRFRPCSRRVLVGLGGRRFKPPRWTISTGRPPPPRGSLFPKRLAPEG